MLPLRLLMDTLTMPLSMVHVSPLSVSVTGALTVNLATFGSMEDEAGGAAEAGFAATAG